MTDFYYGRHNQGITPKHLRNLGNLPDNRQPDNELEDLLYKHCEDLTDVQHIKFRNALLAWRDKHTEEHYLRAGKGTQTACSCGKSFGLASDAHQHIEWQIRTQNILDKAVREARIDQMNYVDQRLIGKDVGGDRIFYDKEAAIAENHLKAEQRIISAAMKAELSTLESEGK